MRPQRTEGTDAANRIRRAQALARLGPQKQGGVSNRRGSLLDADLPPEVPLVTTLNTEDKPGFWARLAARITGLLLLVKGQK